MGLPAKGLLKSILTAAALGVALTATSVMAEPVSNALVNCTDLDKCVDAFEFKTLKTVRIYGSIGGNNTKDIVNQLKMLDATLPEGETIRLIINSPGGEVEGGRAIYDTIMSMNHDIETVCEGRCASMGAALMTAGTPGKRVILPNALVMIHDARFFNLGDGVWTAVKIKELHEKLERSNEFAIGIISRHTNIRLDAMKEFATAKDQWLTAEQAIKLGVADHIKEPKRQPPYPQPDKELPPEFQKMIRGYSP